MAKPKGLGRGLDALLGATVAPTTTDTLRMLPVQLLQPGKYQPRTHMDEPSLVELAESIRTQGVIQPVLVREISIDRYEIIAGERRWRAAQKADLTEVPVIIRQVSDEAVLVMALIENIQREDLNPLEEATSLQRLIDEFGMTHESCAKAVGKSRSAVTNLLRLLNLAEPVREQLMNGDLDMGHARALLTLPVLKQIEMAKQVVVRDLSVRDTEKMVQDLLAGASTPVQKIVKRADPDVALLQEELSDKLGTKVGIVTKKRGRGKLIIEYVSLDQLDSLLGLLRA